MSRVQTFIARTIKTIKSILAIQICCMRLKNGATSQIRTGDITLTKRAFYLLKYSSISKYSRRGSLVIPEQHFSLDCTLGSCAPSPLSFSAYAGFYCSPVNTLIWGGLTPLPETPPWYSLFLPFELIPVSQDVGFEPASCYWRYRRDSNPCPSRDRAISSPLDDGTIIVMTTRVPPVCQYHRRGMTWHMPTPSNDEISHLPKPCPSLHR